MTQPTTARQTLAASSSGRTADFDSANPGSNPGAASNLHFDYSAVESYAKQMQMGWLGPTWLVAFDTEAFTIGMRQDQIDMVFRHHLWHIKLLSDPKTYSWKGRLAMAFYFLTGRKAKQP